MNSTNPAVSQDLLERINPVFNTAKMTLFQLSAAGDRDAAELVKKLGLTMKSTQGDVTEEELLCNTIMLETRYRTMGVLAEKSGCPTEVDLPCGYTPRAIEFARRGHRFVGLDLPAAISEAEPAIYSLIDEDQRQLVRFYGVDATNYASLKEVFDEIPGEVCITTEGLLMYFTDSEAGELCDNIRRILDQHGGCWITADPETALQFVMTSQVIFGDRFMEVMRKNKKHTQDKSDVEVSARTLVVSAANAENGIRNAMMFLAQHGLKAERMIVAEHAPEIESLKRLPQEQAEAIRQTMKKVAYWKITPIPGKQLDTAGTKGDKFDVEAELIGEKMTLRLFGRLDTLTAPGLLTFFEKASEENTIRSVEVDCGNLDYISSAGLRVLLIMTKKCEEGVTVKYANEAVKNIIEQTGFDAILNICG